MLQEIAFRPLRLPGTRTQREAVRHLIAARLPELINPRGSPRALRIAWGGDEITSGNEFCQPLLNVALRACSVAQESHDLINAEVVIAANRHQDAVFRSAHVSHRHDSRLSGKDLDSGDHRDIT